VAETVFPGDLNPGDVIALPDGGEVVVEMIRLGRGGFRVTVSEPEVPGAARVIVLTTWTPLSRRREADAMAWLHRPL
jgi:hypothetical protein